MCWLGKMLGWVYYLGRNVEFVVCPCPGLGKAMAQARHN